MVAGFTIRSKSSAVIAPESNADSRRVRPVRSASEVGQPGHLVDGQIARLQQFAEAVDATDPLRAERLWTISNSCADHRLTVEYVDGLSVKRRRWLPVV